VPSFESQKGYDSYVEAWGKPHSGHKAVLVDPDGKGTSEVPADQVQHYLDKGFAWPDVPSPSPPEPEVPRGVTTTRKPRKKKAKA
jgi:hypothetical protein